MSKLLLEYVVRYFQFIGERHAIYLRRMRGDKWPWTDDPILNEYKFTNIFRELDTGTIYCREAIREPYADHPELFFNIAAYRLFNYTESHKDMGFIDKKYNAKKVMEIMYSRREAGLRVFTGAHMTTGSLGGDKINQVFGLCLTTLWENRRELEPQPGDTLEMAFNRLNKHCPGYGPFISYEVISDLRWTRYLCEATDINTWANPGPGCKRGINRMLGYRVRNRRDGNPSAEERHKYPKSNDEYLFYMKKLLAKVNVSVQRFVPNLEMRDIEHSLCEFDKYERTRLGEGRPRSKYVPPHLR